MWHSCSVCGNKLGDDVSACKRCGAALKEQEAARAVLSLAGSGRAISIGSFVNNQLLAGDKRLAILEVAYSSPFSKYLSRLPGYVQAYYWPSGRAEKNRFGKELPFVDLQRTSFADGSFDIILTHDTLPFVEDINLAFAEMARILTHGGACIAIANLRWPMPATTQTLLQTPDAPSYRTPEGGNMTMRRKLGADLAELMRTHGLSPFFRRMSFHLEQRRNYTVIGVKT